MLYLAVLLGLAWDRPEELMLDRIKYDRHWRVASIAPYLGHIGFEKFRNVNGQERIQVILNGEVVPAFRAQLLQDGDGSYGVAEVQEWVRLRVLAWDKFKTGCVKFMDSD